MSIINRGLSHSTSREPYPIMVQTVATGVSFPVVFVPYPCSVDIAQMTAYGVSGSPTGMFYVNRFIPGTGNTTFPLGSTFALPAYGTSGVVSVTNGISLPQIGSTLATLFPNDIICYQSGGTNSAVTSIAGVLVLRPTADITKYFGIL